MPEASPQVPHDTRRARLAELARVFVRLGFVSFGGPAAHVAMIEREAVDRRGWMDRQHFVDLVGAVNFIPGPNSTEIVMHVGYHRAGVPGLLVAGACFISPAMLIILPIGWFYVRYHDLPEVGSALRGIVAAVVAIIVAMALRFGRTAVKDGFTGALLVLALAAGVGLNRLHVPQAELIVLGAGAVAGALRYARNAPPAGGGGQDGGSPGAAAAPRVPPVPVLIPVATTLPLLLAMFLRFAKIGATLFGSGYVLASYLQRDFVEATGWLTREELAQSISVGQITPGPLLTTSTFIGYVLGNRWYGGSTAMAVFSAVVATVGIFLPSFLFVAMTGPAVERLRGNPRARGALDGMNAAVVALLAIVAVQLGAEAITGWLTGTIAAVAISVLIAWNVNATWLVLGGAVVGWACRL